MAVKTIPITSLSPDELTGRSPVPQQIDLPSPRIGEAPVLPTDVHTLHSRMGRCLLEYRWLRGGSPRTPDMYYENANQALTDAIRVADALAAGLRGIA